MRTGATPSGGVAADVAVEIARCVAGISTGDGVAEKFL